MHVLGTLQAILCIQTGEVLPQWANKMYLISLSPHILENLNKQLSM